MIGSKVTFDLLRLLIIKKIENGFVENPLVIMLVSMCETTDDHWLLMLFFAQINTEYDFHRGLTFVFLAYKVFTFC